MKKKISVSVRKHGGEDLGTMSIIQLENTIKKEIEELI